jgi:aminomethyltransferase
VALVDTNYRAVFSFSGPDAQRYLNAVLTSNVRDLKPGMGTVGLLLTPQGHILAEVETFAQADRILAISHSMVRDRTLSTFNKFVIMDDVEVEDRTPSTGMLSLVGPRAGALISEMAGVDIASMPPFALIEAKMGLFPCLIVRHMWVDHPAAMLIVARENLASLWKELESRTRAHGGAAAGMQAINSLRLESGTPWFGTDFDDKNIPHEAGLEHSHISYEKGCYTGQEIVERVRSRGQVNRTRVGLKLEAASEPPANTPLLSEGKELGYITRTAFSPKLNALIAMGYVRREKSAPGSQLSFPTGTGTVIALPIV